MNYKELDDQLKALEGEMQKMKSAAEHIDESKNAAIKSITFSEELKNKFQNHLEGITDSTSKILEPHKELISTTKELTETLNNVEFPERLDALEDAMNQIKLINIIAFVIIIILLIVILFR